MSGEVIQRIETALAETAGDIRAGLSRREAADERNPSGEQQLAADVRADRLLEERFGRLDGVGTYASEERAEPVEVGSGFAVAVDPLDGSSNLRSNNPMGTIVGVYDDDIPAHGRNLIAAFFVLYGPLTTLVSAHDGQVTERIVENGGTSEARPVSLPAEPTVYGFGGRVPDWPDDVAAFVRELESELKLRYGGAMVADVNQVLTHGGIFAYPALQSAPEGKLRVQFEANPMAYIVETAGGASSDGTGSLLDVDPTELHQRTPVHLGTRGLIDRLEAALG